MPRVRKNLTQLLTFAAIAFFAFAGAGADYLGAKQFELSKNVHGIHFQITVFQSGLKLSALRPAVEKAFAAMKESMDRLDKDGSEGALALNAAEYELVEEAVRFSEITNGAYDPTSGALRELWRQAKLSATPPTQEASDAAKAASGIANLDFNAASKFVQTTKPGLKLDLRDLAEGFALDVAADSLKKSGVRSAVISSDTAILCVGEPEAGKAWRVAIEHPRTIEDQAAVLEIPKASAVATIGDYEDFFMYKGKRYTEAVDPRTGRQPKAALASVTAIAPNAAFAKVLARTFFVMGSEDGFRLVETLKEDGAEVVSLEEDRPDHFNLGSSEGARPAIKEINL